MSEPTIRGKVVRRTGNLAEIRAPSEMVTVFTRLVATAGAGPAWQVVHRGQNGIHLCASADAVGADASGQVTGDGTLLFESLSEEVMLSICAWSAEHAVRQPLPSLLETGIKAIDLLCPLVAGGLAAFFGGPNQGRVRLVQELYERLAGKQAAQRLLFLIDPDNAPGVPQMIDEEPGFPGDEAGQLLTCWGITQRAADIGFLADKKPWTTRLVFSAEEAARENYPALDLVASETVGFGKSALFGPDHVDVAMRVRESLRHLASAAGQPDNVPLTRGLKLRAYLTQPFYVTAEAIGVPGTCVPLTETIADCAAILDGGCDDMAEKALHLCGSVAEARAAGPGG